jgi:hypothetical protein
MSNKESLRVNLYGRDFASLNEPEVMVSATGADALRVVARQLLTAGFDPDRRLALFRGGVGVGSTTLREAARE